MNNRVGIFIGLLFFFVQLNAQEKYSTKTGKIIFEASVPSFEEVKATNLNVSAVLNTNTGEFAALALVKGFRFKVALMEEHFNENYIESSKYPKATFKGSLVDFDLSSIREGKSDLIFDGILNLHGIEKRISVPTNITLKDEAISVTLDFILKPNDFNIDVPAIVRSKIAEEVDVSVHFLLKN